MAIFISSCSIGKCIHLVDNRYMDVKVVHCLCNIDNDVCDFDCEHPNKDHCRYKCSLSCHSCRYEWRCDLE